jgi:hypothetical protein
MELTKETLKNVPLKRLRQTYDLLSTELPSLTDECYLIILERLMSIVGEDAVITATHDGVAGCTIVHIAGLVGKAADVASVAEEAAEVHGFDVSLLTENNGIGMHYIFRLHHLPLELDWIWNTVNTTPITLKTIIKKLKK